MTYERGDRISDDEQLATEATRIIDELCRLRNRLLELRGLESRDEQLERGQVRAELERVRSDWRRIDERMKAERQAHLIALDYERLMLLLPVVAEELAARADADGAIDRALKRQPTQCYVPMVREALAKHIEKLRDSRRGRVDRSTIAYHLIGSAIGVPWTAARDIVTDGNRLNSGRPAARSKRSRADDHLRRKPA